MHISEVRIRNFRNFNKARFILKKGVNTLIGENGSGKTNALYALRLLLDETLSRNAARLRDGDFNRALGRWAGHWIVIAIDFDELDPSEGCQLLKHAAGHMDGSETGTFTFFFRPKREVRKTLHSLSVENAEREAFEAYLSSLTTDEYEPTYSGRSQADFLDDEVYSRVVGDFETLRFPDPEDDDLGVLGVRLLSPLHAEITCTFAQALRDAVSDLRSYRGNPLLALLQGTAAGIPPDDVARLSRRVTELNADISSLPQIRQIASGIQRTLHDTVGHTFSPSVSIESMLPDQMDKLLQRLRVAVGDEGEGDYRGDLAELSLGGANLIYLALKLLEYEMKLSTDRVAHFLLIEEPEAHIHAHVQKTLFDNQASDKTQVILTTHSTHIASAASVSAVNVLARRGAKAEVYYPAHGLDAQAIRRLERYLDAVRSTLLFAKGVILVEGEAELVMVPAMVRSVLGISVDELSVSIVSMSSAFFESVAIIFDEERIRKRCAIITDLDSSFIDLPDDAGDDDPAQVRARAAAEAGAGRKSVLDPFTAGSVWREAFYAPHTFEVDFVSENPDEVVAALEAIYVQGAARGRSAERLTAGLPEAGTEVLRLADKVGKGWFALLLSEELTAGSVIPRYILQALAFASQDNLNEAILKRMGLTRMSSDGFDAQVKQRLEGDLDLSALPPAEFCERFRAVAPQDPLALFMDLVEHVRDA